VVCFMMRRLVHILNTEILKVVFYAHFYFLLKYGIIFWGNSTTIHKVLIIQKKVLRIMLGICPRCSCKSWFGKLHTLPVPSFYIFSLIMFVHNNLDNFKAHSSWYDTNTKSITLFVSETYLS
jgi:hypothetical protein